MNLNVATRTTRIEMPTLTALARRRARRLDRWLAAALLRYEAAVGRGASGAGALVDAGLLARPRAREALLRAAGGAHLDATTLEAEFRAMAPDGEVDAFRRDLTLVATCLGVGVWPPACVSPQTIASVPEASL